MFNELTCKVRFHIAVWSLSNAIKTSSFIENIPQISAKPIPFQWNLLEKLSWNRPLFTNRFQRNWPRKFPRNSCKIGCFFREFVPENPAKFDFFFRDLPEALGMTPGKKWFYILPSNVATHIFANIYFMSLVHKLYCFNVSLFNQIVEWSFWQRSVEKLCYVALSRNADFWDWICFISFMLTQVYS